MYKTKLIKGFKGRDFNWQDYFSDSKNLSNVLDCKSIVNDIRDFLKEEPIKMSFELTRMLRSLLNCHSINKSPKILELGAATAVLTKWLLNEYGGSAVLVDKTQASYEAYIKSVKELANDMDVQYRKEDIFSLNFNETFDIVCSFGLIEHFLDKKDVIQAHKKHIKDDGYILILVPTDSYLSRIYWMVHPELNLGYRELMTTNELQHVLEENELQVLNIITSKNYVYEFSGALCKLQ